MGLINIWIGCQGTEKVECFKKSNLEINYSTMSLSNLNSLRMVYST